MDEFTERIFPPKPRSIEETGLSPHFLADLALKNIHVQGLVQGVQVAEALKLPLEKVVDRVLDSLQRDGWIEVAGSVGVSESSLQYAVSDEGRMRARELMDQSQYLGPAPVTLAAYTQLIKAQSISGEGVSPSEVESALTHLVLPVEIRNQLGRAINAGKSVFLFGNTGDGKTSIGLAVGTMLPGAIWIPYALSVDGQIIKVYDSVIHHPIVVEQPSDEAALPRKGLLSRLVSEKPDDLRWIRNPELIDQRWVAIHRPLVVGGGELTLKNLELVFDPIMKYYEAPHQLKANGGVFLVDDLGRQKVSAREILNRCILPLEKRVDYLTPALGNRFEIPFETLLIFATNLDPAKVADEAFLRRLRYRIHVTDPTWEAFAEIFRREAAARMIVYSAEGLQHVVAEYYLKLKREPRGVHPRDILDELGDIARYRGVPPTMSRELLDRACQSYFLKEETRSPAS